MNDKDLGIVPATPPARSPTPPREAGELQRNIERATAESQRLLGDRVAEIEQMSAWAPPEVLEKKKAELDVFQRIHADHLQKLQEELKARQALDDLKAKAQEKEQERRAAEEREAFKGQARAAYYAAGGSPKEFEDAFPEMWKAELLRRAQGGNRSNHWRAEL